MPQFFEGLLSMADRWGGFLDRRKIERFTPYRDFVINGDAF
jgi:hypothetical protein